MPKTGCGTIATCAAPAQPRPGARAAARWVALAIYAFNLGETAMPKKPKPKTKRNDLHVVFYWNQKTAYAGQLFTRITIPGNLKFAIDTPTRKYHVTMYPKQFLYFAMLSFS
jgi:hypothetical protein